jgi:hypothetical protein
LTNVNKGVYNLLELTGGLDTLLGSFEIPAGTISQIRLVLGSNNSIVVAGKNYNLSTPSAQQSGLKLNVHYKIQEGLTYDFTLDFDAAKSIVENGAGKYILKPVIRVITEALNGAISGIIAPVDSNPVVTAILNNDTISTYPNENGLFLLGKLNEGSYKVQILPKDGFVSKTFEKVTVTKGKVTDLGTIELSIKN